MMINEQALVPYNVSLVVRATQRLLEKSPLEPVAITPEGLRQLCVSCLEQTSTLAPQTFHSAADHLQHLQQVNEEAVKLAVSLLRHRSGSARHQRQILIDESQERAALAAEERARLSACLQQSPQAVAENRM